MMMIISINGIIIFGGLMIIRGKKVMIAFPGLDYGAHDHTNDAVENHDHRGLHLIQYFFIHFSIIALINQLEIAKLIVFHRLPYLPTG